MEFEHKTKLSFLRHIMRIRRKEKGRHGSFGGHAILLPTTHTASWLFFTHWHNRNVTGWKRENPVLPAQYRLSNLFWLISYFPGDAVCIAMAFIGKLERMHERRVGGERRKTRGGCSNEFVVEKLFSAFQHRRNREIMCLFITCEIWLKWRKI